MMGAASSCSADDLAAVRHCVILPFFGRLPLTRRCLELLLVGALPSTRIVLVDDGSEPPADLDPAIRRICTDPRVTLLRHEINRGVSAARNTAIAWCRREGVDILLMIDSDCEPSRDFITEHLRLHREYPHTACIGAAVDGVGSGLWARVDRVMTWVHAIGDARDVKHPYHMVTTNFSVKFDRLPLRDAVFDERLNTGEDALLIRELRAAGQQTRFSPTPLVMHRDRESLRALLWHHYQYGQHQYFVQLGGDLSPRCFHPAYRYAFALAFLPCVPLFALVGSFLNLAPWLRRVPAYALYYPLMYALWVAKGIAVLEAALMPWRVLRPSLAAGVLSATIQAEDGAVPPLPGT